MARDPGDTLRMAQRLTLTATSRSVSNQIGGNDRRDLFRFVLGQRSTLNLALTGLRANANLALLNSRGGAITQSRRSGRQSESIVAPLDAGTYFIQVAPASRRDSTRYRLTASAANIAPSVASTGLSLRAGTATVISGNVLKASDVEQSPDSLVYTLTSIPQAGRLLLGDVELQSGGRFTQADIDSGRLSYVSSGTTTRLTDNSTNDVMAGISGSNLTWNSTEGSANQPTAVKAFFYDGQTNRTMELTAPGITGAAATGISGSDVVWLGSNGTTNQVFLYRGATGTSTPLTSDGRSVLNALISGSNIVWTSTDGQIPKAFFYNARTGQTTELTAPNILAGGAFGVSDSRATWFGGGIVNGAPNFDVFLFDPSTGTSSQLTIDPLIEYGAPVSGINVAWNSRTLDGTVLKSFFFNGQTGQTVELTSPGITLAQAKGISGVNIVWTGATNASSASEVFFYNGSTGASTQLTSNDTNDIGNGISGSNIIWTGFNGTDTDIFFYDGTTNITVELTNNTENDSGALISGSNVAWNTNDGTDSEIVFRRFTPSDSFGFTVIDGVGGTTSGSFNLTITQG